MRDIDLMVALLEDMAVKPDGQILLVEAFEHVCEGERTAP